MRTANQRGQLRTVNLERSLLPIPRSATPAIPGRGLAAVRVAHALQVFLAVKNTQVSQPILPLPRIQITVHNAARPDPRR